MSDTAVIEIVRLEVAALLGREKPDLSAYRIAKAVHDLARLGRQLHRRYEASCSYAWADTERYQRQTDRLEVRARRCAEEIGLDLEFQRDPRGWPLIVKFGDQEHRLGG